MKKIVHCFIYSVILLLTFVGCDVHEFPEERHERVPFLLHLNFNTELPLYKEVVYTRNGENVSTSSTDLHDVRYIINAYRTGNMREDNREADTTFVFTKSDIADLNYTARLELYEGTYTFRVWTDYVDAGSTEDKYYVTSDFSEIILANKSNHAGSNDYRDAFRGYVSATVINPAYYTGDIVNTIDNQATVEMKRPMGKFKFVSTDVEIFIDRVVQMMKDQGIYVDTDSEEGDTRASYEQLLQSINIYDFSVVFRYNIFMPCSFNMFTDKPADSWMGMSFTSYMYTEDYNEMTLGYDYIFVNGSETTLSISVEIYDKDGKLMASSNPIDVPIARSKLTLVKGNFLTAEASEGIVISPEFDGEYNIEIL